jgi:restriction system protein
MAVGSQFTTYINPLLAVLKSLGGSARSAEAKSGVADHLGLSDIVLDERLPSGSSRFENQVSWARYYLVQSGFIDASRRGVWALTEKGRNTEALTQAEITKLVQDVVAEWKASRVDKGADPLETVTEERSPDEPIGDTRTKLLDLLTALPASGFERLCQRLLREAGFEQVTVTGRSGDGGIDGTGLLEVNPFVSFKVLFQCKRYAGTVGPSVVRDFRGAMMGRADKGIIMTTGAFSADSKREAIRDGVPPIELVDGEKLVALFEKLELGLSPRTTYDLLPSFFDEFKD